MCNWTHYEEQYDMRFPKYKKMSWDYYRDGFIKYVNEH